MTKLLTVRRDKAIPSAWRVFYGRKALDVIIVQSIAADQLGMVPRREEIVSAVRDRAPHIDIPAATVPVMVAYGETFVETQ